MHYTQTISSPLGNILLSADEVGLTGLWFDGGRYYAETLPEEHVERETPILMDTKRWLDVYFTGREPDFTPPLHPAGSAFRMTIWRLLLQIPYGQTTTYGELAKRLECGAHVGTGGRRGSRAQSHQHHRSVPSGRRRERQPDRVRGRA